MQSAKAGHACLLFVPLSRWLRGPSEDLILRSNSTAGFNVKEEFKDTEIKNPQFLITIVIIFKTLKSVLY